MAAVTQFYQSKRFARAWNKSYLYFPAAEHHSTLISSLLIICPIEGRMLSGLTSNIVDVPSTVTTGPNCPMSPQYTVLNTNTFCDGHLTTDK